MSPTIATTTHVDRDELLEFVRPRHHVVLLTRRADGSPQASPVTAGVDDSGRIVVSTYLERVKTHNARLRRFTRPGHVWFEPELSYDNARIPEALILGGRFLSEGDYVRDGLAALRWLMQVQTHAPTGVFMPAPTSRFDVQGQDHPLYDQQPIEALASVEACLSAAQVSGDDGWKAEARRALDWFTGRNTQHLSLIDEDGGCCDGLTPNGRNENQGAESLLAWPLSWLAMRLNA